MQLETERLILRPPSMLDAPRMAALAGDLDVAKGTLTIPHPYSEADAKAFIDSVLAAWESLSTCIFAMVDRRDQQCIGTIGLLPNSMHKHAEIGYWVGKPYWGQGYTTEAARRLVDWAFTTFDLNRIYAQHFGSNPASGRVMQKIGMTYEGTMRQHYVRFGEVQDVLFYGILREEWKASHS